MNKLLLSVALLLTFNASANEWKTSFSNDEMRGTAQKFIMLDSENSVNFDFPYSGGSTLTVILRSKKIKLKEGQKADDLKPTEALIVISKGQFICSSYNDCHVSIKFDEGKIQQYSMTEAADGSSDLIFFSGSANVIKNLQSHKKAIIEAEFYQSGREQFKFYIDGLSK